MKHCIFALKDKVADVFGRPMFSANSAVMLRELGDEVRREGSVLASHPADYVLYDLGTWEDSTGLFEALAPRVVFELGSLVENGPV